MASANPSSPRPPTPTAVVGPLPDVRLEMRHGSARPTHHDVAGLSFLIGSVPGCDLRLPAANLPPVLCLITRHPGGVDLRKLAPVLPMLVNGRTVTSATLHDGDRLTLGPVELLLHVQASPSAEPVPDTSALEEQARQLEADRALWYRRRDEIERDCQQLQQRLDELTAGRSELARCSLAVEEERAELEARAETLARQQAEVEALRQELAEIRQQLYERYLQRRDRLAGLHTAVRRAAQKVQKRKRQLDAEEQQKQTLHQAEAAQRAELEARVAELERERQLVEDQRRLLAAGQQEVAGRLSECQQREQQLSEERQALEKGQAQHRADLVRLDRLQASLEQRQQELQQRVAELDRRYEQMQADSRDLEEQAGQLDEWQTRLTAQAEQFTRQQSDQDAAGAALAQRTAALEGQQAMLATLRTRMERMREELRREEQQLAEQRAKQEEAEADLQRRSLEVQQLRAELDAEQQLREQERRQFEERSATLEAAVAQLRQAQESQGRDEQRLREREQTLEATASKQAEQAALVQARAAQQAEQLQRLTADRQALREREAALTQSEQALATFQEQLRKRSEELNARQRALADEIKKHEEAIAGLPVRRAEIDRECRQAEERLAGLKGELDARQEQLNRQAAELEQREAVWRGQSERLKRAGRTLGGKRKALAEERARWHAEKGRSAADLERARRELETVRGEAAALQTRLPEMELQVQAAAERLSQARAQLRDHLAEVHAYARQSREDLETLHNQVQAEAERVRQQELALHRAQDEHRLAVAAFRQQLIEWQAQVAEMKLSLAEGETRLGRRQAEVAEQAHQIDVTSARLARQAEELVQQERVVAERRSEMERHLADMREWYRRKLRELAGVREDRGSRIENGAGHGTIPADADEDNELLDPRSSILDPRSSILTLTGEVEAGDRQLGELLRSLGLVDGDTLTALLVEARRQRRSLRQLLLASNYLTLYQMALIEAGNLDALMLGPVRVIDRLRATPREVAYRVFDPRHNREALLRHLTEAEAEDAVHPDEFRQRFGAAAAVRHPHLAATWEVFELSGRPAVLQEWVTGLALPDWPALAAVAGVWYRLLCQAALGLHTAHEAGLIHGHLEAGHVVLTGEGIVKLCGFGEPPWLAEVGTNSTEGDTAADLATLGRIFADLAALAPRKGTRDDGLHEVVRRLGAASCEERYPSAATLLEDLDRSGANVPPNAAAWERLLRQVREQAVHMTQRLSA